jgi:hypothetical protein
MKRCKVESGSARYIFRAWRRDPRTGDILWARDYGFRAWRIPLPDKPTENFLKNHRN